MFYVLMGVLCSVIGVAPMLMVGRFSMAALVGASGSLLWSMIFYVNTPSTVDPLFGIYGVVVVLMWVISAGLAMMSDEPKPFAWALPILGVVLQFVVTAGGCSVLRADDYARMLGEVPVRNWTQDVQPKDPKHMRMSSSENAFYNAKKRIGEAGAIGSQFQINQGDMTLQLIKGELWYVAPLDFVEFSTWTATSGAPGYIMVHGEDPHHEPVLVQLPENTPKYRYMPGAYFGDNLERYMRAHGYLNVGLEEYLFEIDDDGKGWWVVSTSKPTIARGGYVITGAAVVDPVTGDITQYPLGKVPEWIDRVIPSSFVKNYVNWWGKYRSGWWNSFWAQEGLTEAETPNLIYGSDTQPDWVTGVTSTNENDESLISMIYVNSRTGKPVLYTIGGGSTDEATVQAVNNHEQVSYRKLHGVAPQLYNVYGTMASVVPLLNENHAFQGVAIVDIKNIQTVAVGRDQYEALRVFESLHMQSGGQVALDGTSKSDVVEGVVDRFGVENISDKTIYYIHIDGTPRLFNGSSGEVSPKLPVTKVGDRVRIEYTASDRDVVPIRKFENLSLVLSASAAQQEVRQRSAARVAEEEAKSDRRTVEDRLKNLDPEDLRRLSNQTSPR